MRLQRQRPGAPGDARNAPTVYEVADRAGVSIASVSRVLAGRDRVRTDTRNRVLRAVAELGYVPSGAAQDLAGRRTSVLALCFPDHTGDRDAAGGDAAYWYDEIIRGMRRAAGRSGYALLIAAGHEDDDSSLVLTVAGRCDGMVVLAQTAPLPVLEQIATRVPVVLLAAPTDPRETPGLFDHLRVANETGMYEVTDHLLGTHGYTDIVFIAGPDGSPDSRSRYRGFAAAMRAHGRPVARRPAVSTDFTTAGGEEAVTRLLARRPLPRALACANDQSAIGAMSALRRAGIRVPADVAVTGFDGVLLGRHVHPALTTVVQPMAELGEAAVRLMESRIADASVAGRDIELPVRLEVRASCGCGGDSGDTG